MTRRRYRGTDEDELLKAVLLIFLLYALYLLFLYLTNKKEFWLWVIYGIATVVLVFCVALAVVRLRDKLRARRVLSLFNKVENAGLEERVRNFIVRFGRGEKSKNPWEYRGYKIDWNRINEVIDDFNQKGMNLDFKDFNLLMRTSIDQLEKKVTLNSIQTTAGDFNSLTGGDFEHLLFRLYEKMGYTVQLTGRTGDQGGDLVAMKDEERLLIQAKRYANMHVGNDAVQQAFAAKSFYDCNKAVVITTSEFTREAIELSKTTGVELISKNRLQQLLLEHLLENWN